MKPERGVSAAAVDMHRPGGATDAVLVAAGRREGDARAARGRTQKWLWVVNSSGEACPIMRFTRVTFTCNATPSQPSDHDASLVATPPQRRSRDASRPHRS